GERRKLIAGTGQVRHGVAAVERQRRDWLHDEAGARRYEMVDAAQLVASPVVVILEIEVIEAKPRNQLERLVQRHLILNIRGGDIGAQMIVRVRGALSER